MNDDSLKGLLHLRLEVTQIVLHSSLASERCGEGNILSIFGEHTLRCSVWATAFFYKFHVLHTIEAIADILVDLFGVVTVGENIKQGLI